MSPPEHSLTLVRILEAPAERVYQAWTDPKVMGRWLGEMRQADIRVGGRFHVCSESEGVEYHHCGEIQALEPNHRIRMSFFAGHPDQEGQIENPYLNEFIEINLRELGPGETEMTFLNGWDGQGATDEELEAAKTGWGWWLDALAQEVEE